ncbi:efflux transporter outer membrane subunit [Glaciimonas sp. PAMC28666]|uniref:efflux transporter outer membrane subunit n=1 Tax=Glaciimonas sp. PAMC28666 TaxID=2807626 RepID=UPI0019653866|nr:efflux transporter outer membrane subunit [Glaciimonas sp. PAMC28666]QRX83397.1 efflux transporter outer membrane subunit [Glaciimonas sp. PAMC28666]
MRLFACLKLKSFVAPYSSTLALGVLCAFLAGCAHNIPISEPPPAVEMPAGWTLSGKPSDQEWPDNDWWKRFGSVELTQLVDEGQRSNLEIAAALARVRQAEAQARIAGAPLLPTADFSAGGNRDLPLGNNGAANTSASGLLQVSYEIDFWGKNKASLAAAEASLKANLYDRQTVALTVTSGIVSTFLQVLSLHDRLNIARENVANAERVLALVEAQSSAGAASPLDLARQRSAVAGQKASIPDLMQQEREAQSALAILLGRSSQTFKVADHGLDTIALPDVTPGLPSELLSRRPDIRRAEAQLAAANANVAVARAALFPSIRLTGSTGAQSGALLSLFNGPNLLANVGTSLVAPIFDAGLLKNQRDLAIAQKQELVQVYRSTVISALSEVDKVLGQIRSLDEQRSLKTTEMEQARFAFNLSEIRYRVGAEDLMTVLDTQRALSDVQNELGALKLKRLQATVSLYKALGGGWQDDASHKISPVPVELNPPKTS